MFRTNDIILNFRRSTVYPFNVENTKIFNVEIFSCRLASFNEIELYFKFVTSENQIVKFKQLGFNKKNTLKKSTEIDIKISNVLLIHLHKIASENDLTSYDSILNLLISVYSQKDYESLLTLQKEIETIKNSRNTIKEMIIKVLDFFE